MQILCLFCGIPPIRWKYNFLKIYIFFYRMEILFDRRVKKVNIEKGGLNFSFAVARNNNTKHSDDISGTQETSLSLSLQSSGQICKPLKNLVCFFYPTRIQHLILLLVNFFFLLLLFSICILFY